MKGKYTPLTLLESLVIKNPLRYLSFLSIIYTLIFSILTIKRFYIFKTSFFDLGIYMNVLFNSAHGQLFMGYNFGREINYLGIHQSYILIILVPFYQIISNATFLLILQSFAISLGVFPLYFIGRKVLGASKAIYIIPILYLLTPTLQWSNSYDFHPSVLTTSLLLFLWWFLLMKRYKLATLLSIVFLLTKEDKGFIIFTLCLYFFFATHTHKEKIYFTILGLLGFFTSFFEFFIFIPYFSIIHQSFALARYRYLGTTYGDILHTIIFRPGYFIACLLYPFSKTIFILKILVQTGGLALFSPIILIAIPEFMIDLLGTPAMHNVSNQYTTSINALIWISSIYGIYNGKLFLHHFKNKYLKFIYVIPLSFTFIAIFSMSPILRIDNYSKEYNASSQRQATLNTMLKKIPANGSVSASEFIYPQISNRKKAYLFPESCTGKYIISEPLTTSQKIMYKDCLKIIATNYNVIYEKDGYIVAIRNSRLESFRYFLLNDA